MTVDQDGNLYVTSGSVIRKGTLATAPVINAQPQGTSVAAGASATIAVTASGAPEPTYQWKHDGKAIAGATGRSLTIASAQAADAGDYTVVVANSLGSVTSNTATLTVNSGPVQPSISSASGGGGGSIGGSFLLGLLALAASRLVAGRHLRRSR